MRILLLHNSYQQKGGEDSVFEAENKLLLDHGDNVIEYRRNNQEISGYSLYKKLSLFQTATWSRESYNKVREICREQKPDIAHFHNTLPLITPSAYFACQDQGVPVVQTLHNYRLICPGALLLRNGKICEDCLTGSIHKSVFHRCYRDSAIETCSVVKMLAYHRRRGTWKDKVDRYIALTNFAGTKFIEGGLPAGKIVVKPNFIERKNIDSPPESRRSGALFVGRVSAEKGIGTLLEAWRSIDYELRIAGDGPLMEDVKNAGIKNIKILGRLSADEVALEMRRSAFLVIPSNWYEGFPMVLLEAFANGLAVVASRLGSLEEIVEENVTGIRFTASDARDLTEKVNSMIAHPDECKRMGENARSVYEEKYSPERNYKMLIDIYNQAIDEKER